MSHISRIDIIPIRDTAALEAAVKELQAQGVKCDLVTNAKPRLWNEQQAQTVGNCDYVLKLPNIRFDVGFKAVKEENNQVNRYEMVLDLYGQYVQSQIGYQAKQDEDQKACAVGRLTQEYTKQVTMNAAIAAGYSVRSCEKDENGKIQMVLAGFN